jgi:c-di-GMP-binding flagellar brake protein YcgR
MATVTATPQRRAGPRVRVALPMRFERAKGHGNPVEAQTVDLSTGGARIVAERPLKVDEVLRFELGERVRGECRVLREHPGRTYAVRFERLADRAAADELARVTGAS